MDCVKSRSDLSSSLASAFSHPTTQFLRGHHLHIPGVDLFEALGNFLVPGGSSFFVRKDVMLVSDGAEQSMKKVVTFVVGKGKNIVQKSLSSRCHTVVPPMSAF